MTEPQIISPDQWVVTGRDANHRRTWSVTVRASTLENAKRVAWQNPGRPAWVSIHTLLAEPATVRNDPLLRVMLRDGFAREVPS
jgi:hypothetical protein